MTQDEITPAPASAPGSPAASRSTASSQTASPRGLRGENTEVTRDASKEEGGQESPHGGEPGSSAAGPAEVGQPDRREGSEEDRREAGEGAGATVADARYRSRREGRLSEFLRPWWKKEPALVKIDEADLASADFRVTREVDDLGRLNFVLEKDGRHYRLCYPHDLRDPVGYELIDGRPAFRSIGGYPLEVARNLVARLGEHVLPPARGRVLIPAAWFERVTGDAGTFEVAPAGGDARALAVRGITGTGNDARLSAAARSLVGSEAPIHEGLWARSHWRPEGDESVEEAVAEVERALATTHGLTPALVRELMRTVTGAAVRSPDGSGSRWRFVRRGEHGEPVLLQTVVVGSTVSSQRAPYSESLAGQRVAVVGCGSIGASVTLQLARSGVRSFLVIDDERLEPGNLARMDSYLNQAGRLKVDALADQLRLIAPGIEVETGAYLLGEEVGPAGLMAYRPDLIVNTTAEEIGSDETNIAALALSRPAIFAWVSQGIKGGRILRIRPGSPGGRAAKGGSACYECVRNAAPRRIPSAGPAPHGTAIPWTGAVHDAGIFAAAVTRTAVLTLAGAPVSDRNPDHAVLRFGGVVPTAGIVRIPRDPDCAVCGG